MVNGDDLFAVGPPESLEDLRAQLENQYKIKTETLGGGESDKKEMRVLIRIIRWDGQGLRLEADPRHAEILIQQHDLHGAPSSRSNCSSSRSRNPVS